MEERLCLLIDGFNLGLESGTGVATYARNVSYCAHALGYRTDILYDTDIGVRTSQLLREIYFFDPLGRATKSPWLNWIKHLRELAAVPFDAYANSAPVTGKIITTHYKSQLPYFDTLWGSPDVFGRAYRKFAVYQNIHATRLAVHLKERPHIAHWTYPLPIHVPGAKNIYTIHDLVPLRLPFTTLDNKKIYYSLVKMLAEKADHIITVSENSRKDIINLLGVPENKVTNTYQSVDIPEKYASKSEAIVKNEIEGTLDIKYKEYMLFFGAIEPKKNIGRLIEAYLASNTKTPLVIVGKKAWRSEQELRLLQDDATSYLETLGSRTFRRRRILQLDYVPFPMLVSLIKGAKAVLFPSLYEGFGLPALEAMKLGTPVLTSSEGSMPEVAADGALVVDPYDTRALAEAISALDTNAELRAELADKGRKRAAFFSPEAHSQKLASVYQSVLDKKDRS